MQAVEYTLDDQPIILSKCEEVSLITAAASRKGLCLVNSIIFGYCTLSDTHGGS